MTGRRSVRIAVGTAISRSYLAFARVLAESLREYHCEIPLYGLIVDDSTGTAESVDGTVTTLRLDDLRIRHLQRYRFQYTRQQILVTAKAYLLEWMLQSGFSSAVYLDADILITGDLTSAFELVTEGAITLSPHFLSPATGATRSARELELLRSGVFNGGFVGVSDSPTARQFLAWWQDRLYRHCESATECGMHFDQRWLDLAPACFDGVQVLRDAGVNVAYWNLPERPIEAGPQWVRAGDVPCRLFHFSGFDPENVDRPTRYHTNLTMKELGEAAVLFRGYAKRLAQAGYADTKGLPYGFDRFDDGTAIPDVARQLYLQLGTKAAGFGDPFQTRPSRSFFRWLNEPANDDGRPGMTRLWQAIYQRRPDVQRAFPDADASNAEGFLHWACNTGRLEHGVSPKFPPFSDRTLENQAMPTSQTHRDATNMEGGQVRS